MNKLLLMTLACLLLLANGNNERENERRNTPQPKPQFLPKPQQNPTGGNFGEENSGTGEREKRMSDNGSFGYAWNIGSGVSYLKMHVQGSSGSSAPNDMAAAQHQVEHTLRDGGVNGQQQKYEQKETNTEKLQLSTNRNKISGNNLGERLLFWGKHINGSQETYLNIPPNYNGGSENNEPDSTVLSSGIHGITEDKSRHNDLKHFYTGPYKFEAGNSGWAQVHKGIHDDALDVESYVLRLSNSSQNNLHELTNNGGNTRDFEGTGQKNLMQLGLESNFYGPNYPIDERGFPVPSENSDLYNANKFPQEQIYGIDTAKTIGIDGRQISDGVQQSISSQFPGGLFSIYNHGGYQNFQNFGNYKQLVADNQVTLKDTSPSLTDEKSAEATKKETRNTTDKNYANNYGINRGLQDISATKNGEMNFHAGQNTDLHKNMEKYIRQLNSYGKNSEKQNVNRQKWNERNIKVGFPFSRINLENDNIFGKQSTVDKAEIVKQIEYSNIGGFSDGRFAGAGIYDVLDGNEKHQIQGSGHSLKGFSTHKFENDNDYNANEDKHFRYDIHDSTIDKKNIGIINTFVGENYGQKVADTIVNQGKEEKNDIQNSGATGFSYIGTPFRNLNGKQNMHEQVWNSNKDIVGLPYFGDRNFLSELKNTENQNNETERANEWSKYFPSKVENKQYLLKVHSLDRNKEEPKKIYDETILKQNDDGKSRKTKSIETSEGGPTGIEHLLAGSTIAKQNLESYGNAEQNYQEEDEIDKHEEGTNHEDIGQSGHFSYSLQKEPEIHEVTNTVPVQKEIKIPVPHPVHQPILIPVPVRVMEPYPIKIPVPVAVEKTVQVPVEKVVPYPVEKPVPMKVYKEVPVPVPKPYPVKVPVYKIKYIHHTKKNYD